MSMSKANIVSLLDGCKHKDAVSFEDVNFSDLGISMKESDISNASFYNCNFTGMCLDNAKFNHCIFVCCNFTGASLHNVKFYGTKLRDCNTNDADFTNANFLEKCRIEKNVFENTIFENTFFDDIVPLCVIFTKCNLKKAKIDFDDTILRRRGFWFTFEDCNLSYATICCYGNKPWFENCDTSHVIWTKYTLKET